LKQAQQQLSSDSRSKIWMHCASLGEFEQGRPVMEALKEQHPAYSIVLTFFSPSGYEVKKNFEGADHVFYLPLDSRRNARRFIALLQPVCVLFVKYEFWYHYLHELYRQQIPAVLFSAIFQERHPFFKWYGGLHRKMLGFYRQIFVQNETSRSLLESVDIRNMQIAGDTRFDRAAKVLQQDRSFPALEAFKGDHQLIVAGSNWHDDNVLLAKLLQWLPDTYKLLIAPHETDEATIARTSALFTGGTGLWTEEPTSFAQHRVGIVNTIGQLAYLYKYADVVWIGGGFTRSGIHNVIEPAVFGKPVFFGPVYDRYREAVEMIAAGAACSVPDAESFFKVLQQKNALLQMGSNAEQYVHSQLGATATIMNYLSEKYLLTKE
jgi:3-deoxy-D-manno-octulosonic-acid transferase